MRKLKTILSIVLVSLLLITITGCSNESEEFNHSRIFDENGFIKNINASELILDFDYTAIVIPDEIYQIDPVLIQQQFDNFISAFFIPQEIEVFNRSVRHGDIVNIDFVGSIDGVEFEGGSTGGRGMDVIIGVTNFIDDFLDQVIGRNPGETFNVYVTFPENYGVPHLDGQPSIFVTTVNYIVEIIQPELTDEMIADVFSEINVYTIDELYEFVRTQLRINLLSLYIEEFLFYDVDIAEIPSHIFDFFADLFVQRFLELAERSNMELEDFLEQHIGISTSEELIVAYADWFERQAVFAIIVQAIAESANIVVTDDDITDYFIRFVGIADFSGFEEEFGLPYIKSIVLQQLVLNHVVDTLLSN